MSDKEQYVNHLATITLDRHMTLRAAVHAADVAWEELRPKIGTMSQEDLADAICFLYLAGRVLEDDGGVASNCVFNAMQNIVHARTCPKCKDNPEYEHQPEDGPGPAQQLAGLRQLATFVSPPLSGEELKEFVNNLVDSNKAKKN